MILSEPQKIAGRSISNVKQHLLKKLLLNSNVSPCNIYFKENEHKESTVLKFYHNLQFHFFHIESIYENTQRPISVEAFPYSFGSPSVWQNKRIIYSSSFLYPHL